MSKKDYSSLKQANMSRADTRKAPDLEVLLHVLIAIALLYVFLVAIKCMGTSFKLFGI